VSDPREPTARLPLAQRAADHPEFLVLTLILLALVNPTLQKLRFTQLLTSTLFTLLYLSAILTLPYGRRGRLIVVGLGLVSILLKWLISLLETSEAVLLLERLTSAVFLGVLVGTLLRCILAARKVSGSTLWHAIGCYLLLGLGWMALYKAVVLIDPEAIRGLGPGSIDTDFMYFSFTCLTTLGFGDITPTAPYARSLTVLESVAGQLFIAIVIAKLVSLYSSGKSDRREAP
jgi:hypothetical protein